MSKFLAKQRRAAKYVEADIERQQARLLAIFGPKETAKLDFIEECYSCGEYRTMTYTDNYHTWTDAGEKYEGFFCNDCISNKRRDR